MNCLKCPKKAYYNRLCRKHFMKQIEARVRKEIRAKGLIKKSDVLVVKDPFCRFFIKKIMGGMPLKLVKSEKGIGKSKNAKIVLPWTLDDEILSFLMDFFGEKVKKKAGKNKTKEIKPFRRVKEDELTAFSRLVKVKFKKKKRTKREEEIKKALERIEKKHPETKFSLLKSVEEIIKIRQSPSD